MIWTTDNPAMPVVIHFPSPMSEADVQDLREVVALWLRSLERQAFQDPPASGDGSRRQAGETGGGAE
jgi:hypothetical protein